MKVNVKGYPSCKGGQLEARDTKAAMKVCGDTVLGNGIAHVEIAFPEQKPLLVTSPLTVFNGGEKGGKVTLYFHIFLTVPVPAAIVTTVTIQRKGTGIHSIAKVPVAAGGSGSAIDFNFKLGKTYSYKGKKVGYFEARCPDGVFKATAKNVVFKNEAHVPGVAAQTRALAPRGSLHAEGLTPELSSLDPEAVLERAAAMAALSISPFGPV